MCSCVYDILPVMTKTEIAVYKSICSNPLAVASSIALEIGKQSKFLECYLQRKYNLFDS